MLPDPPALTMMLVVAPPPRFALMAMLPLLAAGVVSEICFADAIGFEIVRLPCVVSKNCCLLNEPAMVNGAVLEFSILTPPDVVGVMAPEVTRRATGLVPI